MQKYFAFLVLVGARLAAGYEDKIPYDGLEDDDTEAIAGVRKRLEVKDSSKFGVVLVAGPAETSWSAQTIPLWRAYCQHHGFGFWLQEERLNTDYAFEWTKPRLLMEILPKTKWRYLMLVDAASIPLDFNRSWEYAIKVHMRFKRWRNDKPADRVIFSPWDCQKEYDSAYTDGACYGPNLHSTIYWANGGGKRQKKTTKMVKSWYVRRKEGFTSVKAFDKMRGRNWEQVFYKDVQAEIGRQTSSFIPLFSHDEARGYGWNLREQIFDFIKNHTEIANIANRESKLRDKAEL